MAQLKAMINGLSDQKPEKPAPRAEAAPAAETEPAESKKKPSGAPLPAAVFAAVKETAPELQPEPVPQPEKTEQPVADFFGKAQSEDAPQAPLAPAEEPAAKEDTMSLPLLPLDGEEPQQAPEKAPAAPQPELKAEAEDAVSPEEHAETELTEPEATADKLHRMSAELTLRCVLGGILAVVLLHFGLVSDGLLPAMAALDPDAAPAAFYGANLLLLAASLCVGFPVLRDGLNGLRGRSSSETMPALAAVAALVQAVTAMLNANVYRGTTGISLLSGMAALGLFLALLGSRVMLAAVKGGYELVTNGVEFEGAYRAKDKDLLRALARDLEQKDPWVLLSRPMKEADGFVEQSLSERASERRARKVSYILLGVALLSGVLFLLAGAGWNKAAAAMAAVLCMGAPLSSTLIAGVASLRLQRAAAAVGAVIPGWQAIEQLGGIDTLHPLCKNCLIRVQGNPLGAPAPHQVGQKVPAICQKAGLRLAQIKYKLGAAVVVQVASNSKSFIGDGVSWCIAIEDVSLGRGLSVAGFVGQRQIEIQRLPGDCLPQFPGRLRRGQSTHGDTVDSRIRIKGPQRPGIGAQAEICARQCQHDHAQSDIKALPALFQAGAALFLHTGFVDLFHEAPPAVP